MPIAFCRLDAVAHGGNPQDRAASLLPLAFLSNTYVYNRHPNLLIMSVMDW
ncbi:MULTISPECIES: hypothetical protein [Moorena]|uniref:hypothetical protein n=1 Tax=Moorena TaxID=1155738 RepID=UPI0013143C57|nr:MULTISPECIES: hypothetical protein [Moorena]NEO77772.1 hypothetical protein [Moorena sp. SIO4G3]